MQKIGLVMLIVLLLCSCAPVKPNVPDTPEGKAAQVLVEKFITANKAYDAEAILSLYADDMVSMDYGMDDGPFDKASLDVIVKMYTNPENYKNKYGPYIITPDGRFVVIQVEYSKKGATGKWVSTPTYGVLELKNGKIFRETWYYNGEVFR